ncbi:ABC transporter ATP-binding protein, partial [Streptomyces sp. NPDC059631]
MSMETTAWTQLHSVLNAEQERRPFARATLRRIGAFARPHRRRIVRFVVLGVGTAQLAGAPPRLARPGGDAHVYRGGPSEVVRQARLNPQNA